MGKGVRTYGLNNGLLGATDSGSLMALSTSPGILSAALSETIVIFFTPVYSTSPSGINLVVEQELLQINPNIEANKIYR